MTKRELAELLLSARRSAGRISSVVVPDRSRLNAMGLTDLDIDLVEWAIDEIERTTEVQLAALEP